MISLCIICVNKTMNIFIVCSCKVSIKSTLCTFSIMITIMSRYLIINDSELPRPQHIVEELSVVMSVVIGTVCLSMVTRGHHRHLVTVDRVVTEKQLHFLSHLQAPRLIVNRLHNKDVCAWSFSKEVFIKNEN